MENGIKKIFIALVIVMITIISTSCITTKHNSIREVNNVNLVTASGPEHAFNANVLNPSVKNVDSNAFIFVREDSTFSNIENALHSNTDINKTNIIIFTGHSTEGKIILEDHIKYDKIIELCKSTPQDDIIIVSACYSSTIRNSLGDTEGIAIITNTDSDSSTSSNEDVGLIKSVSSIFNRPSTADYNDDGFITVEEFHKKAINITNRYLRAEAESLKSWNNAPKSNYGIYGDSELVILRY